jgi:hypothetical protein
MYKSLLLLFTNAGEGAGFNVRGRRRSKLNLLTRLPFFSSHVFGFLRFNPDAIKDLKFYKELFLQILESCLFCLDIYQKTGTAKFHMNGGKLISATWSKVQ